MREHFPLLIQVLVYSMLMVEVLSSGINAGVTLLKKYSQKQTYMLPESRSTQPAGKNAVICYHLLDVTAGSVITPQYKVLDCQRGTFSTGCSVSHCHLTQLLLKGEENGRGNT